MTGITFMEQFIAAPDELITFLENNVTWDERMQSRKTASFGKAYNYSQISYPYQEMPAPLAAICSSLKSVIGFEPNNCLINLYPDGSSKMGWHSDQMDILETGTGIAIVSLGATRTLRFREIADKSNIQNFNLPSGSLIYMTQEVQQLWQHSIPPAPDAGMRISLTFRQLV
ncbi:alpha-ketoglutarate-dependent dioxygenase AlkB [Chitinophagaceae bacterium MMS25-I14]